MAKAQRKPRATSMDRKNADVKWVQIMKSDKQLNKAALMDVWHLHLQTHQGAGEWTGRAGADTKKSQLCKRNRRKIILPWS